MKTKGMYVLFITGAVLVLALAPSSTPQVRVSAQETGTRYLYFPQLSARLGTLLDDFSDEDPVWTDHLLKDPKDGYFEHRNGRLVAEIKDNTALIVSTPGWRAPGDFMLDVDARFSSGWTIEHKLKSLNGLGLAFCGSDDWEQFYAVMLQENGSDHNWAVIRVEDEDFHYLTEGGWRGDHSATIKDWDAWNHLTVVRSGDEIKVWVNGMYFGKGNVHDSHYGTNRLVGLVVASYEFSDGQMQFDNFRLTRLTWP